MTGLGLAYGIFAPQGLDASPYAESVEAYESGTGFAVEFGTGRPLTDSAAALGPPSRETPGEFGGPVDPFAPPFSPDQLVSLGEGGSLTVGFDTPIRDDPANPYGLDFLVFGSTGFTIVNGDFSGGGITDGSLFGHNAGGTSEVFVSPEGIHYYRLDVTLAPPVDGYFPTDGTGDFTEPVDPGLGAADFDGLGLTGIRDLYDGSGGGTGYDLGWARDDGGNPIPLDSVRFVRIDVTSGRAEIDGFAVVPEPDAGILGLLGITLTLIYFQLRHKIRSVHRRKPRAAENA